MDGSKNITCHFLSLNCRGLRNKEKRDVVFSWCRNQKVDILLLQETYWTQNIQKIIRTEWKGPCYFNEGSNHSRGTAILVSKHLPLVIENVYYGQEGRVIMINAKLSECSLSIVNVYAPTERRNKESFFKHLTTWIKAKRPSQYKLVVCGDFNSVLSPDKDVKGNKTSHYKTPQNFKRLIKSLELYDVWRKLNPVKHQFTWRNIFLNCASRIDYWLIDTSLKTKVISSDIRPALRCDHNAISLKLLVGKSNKGPGYWKLNTQVLKDENYKSQVRNIIQEIGRSSLNNVEKWELIKIKCREFSQRYCQKLNKKTNTVKIDLLQKFVKISEKVDEDTKIEEEVKKDYIQTKFDLEKIYTKECKGACIRSRIKWFEDGERNTKYFLSLEKKNAEKKSILSLKIGKRVIFKQNEILNEVAAFFEELYTSKNVKEQELNSYFDNVSVDMLNDDEKKMCEGLLSNAECHEAVFKMARNKSPGGDGLPIEFYQEFWNDIELILVNALNESVQNKCMSETQKQGIITLIYKKGEMESLNNWRPITLLNCDYKIMAAVLANRLHKVIPNIIHENQVGYIKKRLSGFNIRLTQDIFEYTKKKGKTCASMIVDFRQAFDTVESEFIEKCLVRFNFGEEFRSWIKLLYTDVTSSVIQGRRNVFQSGGGGGTVNGWKTKSFKIGRNYSGSDRVVHCQLCYLF